MGHDNCPVESRRLLWLIGITFCVILLVHLELPYNKLLSFESPAREAVESRNSSLANDGFALNHEIFDGIPELNDSSAANNSQKEIVAENVNHDLVPEETVLSNESRRIDSHNKESLSDQSLSPSISPTEAPEEFDHSFSRENDTKKPEEIEQHVSQANISLVPEATEHGFSHENVSLAPEDKKQVVDSSSNLPSPSIVKPSIIKPAKPLENNHTALRKKPLKTNMPSVISITEMNELLLQSQSSRRRIRRRWSSPVDRELLRAKTEILNAPILQKDDILYAPLYRNVSMFKRSYELMEAMLKVYIYREGERPVFHQPTVQGIYASEGWFMKLLESNRKFVTRNGRKAHLFYLPFGSRNLEETLYVANSHSHKNLIQYLKDYLDIITSKYSFWNRTEGADHFLVACHDWAPSETKKHMANCIRALCNSDVKEGFAFGKDVALPETYVLMPKNPLKDIGGLPPSKRSTLAFFAGNMHGYLRPILLQHWQNKDPDMKIFGVLPKSKGKMNYVRHMQSSKYCICAKGYEVNSPRVVEAIFYECVPVIISDNFVPPFFDILNWESFAVFVLEKDIPNLKNILLSIPQKQYLRMQMRVKKVQQHFLWHTRPVKYDLFHMILHSIWYSRVFQL